MQCDPRCVPEIWAQGDRFCPYLWRWKLRGVSWQAKLEGKGHHHGHEAVTQPTHAIRREDLHPQAGGAEASPVGKPRSPQYGQCIILPSPPLHTRDLLASVADTA